MTESPFKYLPDPEPQRISAPQQRRLPKVGARGLFQKLINKKFATLAGVAGLAYFLFGKGETVSSTRDSINILTDSLLHPLAKRNEYISSSSLGLHSHTDLIGRVYDPVYGDIVRDDTPYEQNRSRQIMEAGDFLHSMIQRNLLSSGIAADTEKYVEDPKNKVFGYIDVVQKSGIPLEIKSVSEREFRSLREPKASAVSQANFYALAMQSPVAQIMYVAREAPSMTKVFTISADPGKYLQDVERIRKIQEQFKNAPSSKPYLTGFRPLSSWLGGGINYNMPYAHRSKLTSQRIRLADLPVSQNWAQEQNRDHSNMSRAGVI